MQFSGVVTAILLATFVSATALPKRQTATIWQSPFNGTIVAPTAYEAVVGGSEFAFEYTVSNWCQSSYSPFVVYLTEGTASPTFSKVTENGTLVEGAYLHEFGKFVVAHFGLPQQGLAPPSSFVLPRSVAQNLSQASLTVVQEFDSCPGHIVVEYGVASVPLQVVRA